MCENLQQLSSSVEEATEIFMCVKSVPNTSLLHLTLFLIGAFQENPFLKSGLKI